MHSSVVLTLLCVLATAFAQNTAMPPAVSSLQLSAFLGRWFVMYMSPSMSTSMASGNDKLYCVTMDNTLFSSTSPITASQPVAVDMFLSER